MVLIMIRVASYRIAGGDPTGTGRGGTSIYGGSFEDEIHPDLKFTGAGIIAVRWSFHSSSQGVHQDLEWN